MKKTLLFLATCLMSLGMYAADNLLAGGTNLPVMLQRSSHEYTETERGYLVDGVKNATESNTVNLDLFYDEVNDGFYFDLGAQTKLGVVMIYWTGKHCTNYKIYASNEVPTLENPGTEIGSFNEYGALNDDTRYKSYAGGVGSEYRYVAYVPDETANFYGSMMSEFEVFTYEEATLTALSLNTGIAVFNTIGNGFNANPTDQNGITIESGVTYTADNGAEVYASGNAFTLVAPAAGIYTITATAGDKTATAKVALIDAAGLPAEPTATSGNVLSVFCDTYSDAETGISDPAWNWKYTTRAKPEIATGNYIYIIDKVGTFGLNPGATDITGYSKLNLDIYVVEATTGYVVIENSGLTLPAFDLAAGWNRLALDIEGNEATGATWIQIYIGASAADNNRSIALDNVYYSKEGIDDDEAPVLEAPVVKGTNAGSVTLTLKATDNLSQKITYVVTDKASGTVYTAKGDNGADFDFVVSPLQSGTDYTFSVVAKDANDNASAAQEVSATTTALVAAPTPTVAADDVMAIYSDAYTPATTYGYGYWGQSTVVDTEAIEGNEALKLTNYNYLGFEYATQLDLSEMQYLHIDVLPMQETALGITPILVAGTPTENSTKVGTLKVGEWNSIDIALADFGMDFTNLSHQLKIDGGTGTDMLYVDNIYFWKQAGSTLVATDDLLWNVSDLEAGDITATTILNNIEVAATADKKVTIDSNKKSIDGYSFTQRLKTGGTSTAEARHLHLKVKPSTQITVYGMSSSSSETRTLNIAVGAYGDANKQASLENDGKAIGKVEYVYEGEANADIYLYTNDKGFNIYAVKVEPYVKPNVVPVPTEPTFSAEDVLAVYSQKYGKAEITTTNPAWGGYKDATGEDLYTAFDYVELNTEDGTHKVVHVNGTGINSRTAGDVSAEGYNKFYAAIYPTTATSAVIFKDNGYADRVTITGLVPGQWNYVEKEVSFDNFYLTLALDGETEFYVDNILFVKDATNGIANVQQSALNVQHYYDLQGRRVAQPQKGLYVVNGRKVVIK